MKKRALEQIKENEVFINEYEQMPVYNANQASEEMYQKHCMHIESAETEQERKKTDYTGKQTAGRIIKAGKTKTGRIWLYYQIIGTNQLIVTSYSPSHFLSLLQGINGIYAEIVKDADGFPIGQDILLTPQELTERLRENRICFVDNVPIKICA